jgi:hypothetical protein
MPVSAKSTSKDDTRIGEYAAKQPLSGIHVVTKMPVKGISNQFFIRTAEVKKAG